MISLEELKNCRNELELSTYSTKWRDPNGCLNPIILFRIKNIFDASKLAEILGCKYFLYSFKKFDIVIQEKNFEQYKSKSQSIKITLDLLLIETISKILSKYNYPNLCFKYGLTRDVDPFHRIYKYDFIIKKYRLKKYRLCQK